MHLKRNVFSSGLKVVIDLQVLMSSGREFHSGGIVYEDALSSYSLYMGL